MSETCTYRYWEDHKCGLTGLERRLERLTCEQCGSELGYMFANDPEGCKFFCTSCVAAHLVTVAEQEVDDKLKAKQA